MINVITGFEGSSMEAVKNEFNFIHMASIVEDGLPLVINNLSNFDNPQFLFSIRAFIKGWIYDYKNTKNIIFNKSIIWLSLIKVINRINPKSKIIICRESDNSEKIFLEKEFQQHGDIYLAKKRYTYYKSIVESLENINTGAFFADKNLNVQNFHKYINLP